MAEEETKYHKASSAKPKFQHLLDHPDIAKIGGTPFISEPFRTGKSICGIRDQKGNYTVYAKWIPGGAIFKRSIGHRVDMESDVHRMSGQAAEDLEVFPFNPNPRKPEKILAFLKKCQKHLEGLESPI